MVWCFRFGITFAATRLGRWSGQGREAVVSETPSCVKWVARLFTLLDNKLTNPVSCALPDLQS